MSLSMNTFMPDVDTCTWGNRREADGHVKKKKGEVGKKRQENKKKTNKIKKPEEEETRGG